MSDMTFADAISAMRYFERNGFEIEVRDRDNFSLIHKESGSKNSFSTRQDAINWVRGFVEAKRIYTKQ